ncbi:cyclin-L1-1 isoform X5 [Magnolia sinica]|uniref:cyclin-L1-1 isoform X5 n=1 Tax=Magnolia sinica TaxID=86752 RepID=UPI002659A1C9|nr:cyclin-L1-1 isoform X5 [Magnolia sinica]
MIYTAIDTFYLTDEQLRNSPSRKDGIDETTEMTLRIYGCDLIQESGILLKLPQAVMATGQVLFHRFYCKKSFARFNVKRVAASCVWLASKLEESPRKAKHVLIVFHRMECRRENLPIEHLDPFSKKYSELKMDLNRTERHLLKEMGFICHVEHPHKFISNYLATLETPLELRQEAWNLANDSSVNDAANDTSTPKAAVNDAGGCKDSLIKAALDKLKVSKKTEDDMKIVPVEGEAKEETAAKPKLDHRTDASGERNRERERERMKVRDRDKGGRDSDREREKEQDRDREKLKERSHRVKDKGKDSGHSEKSRRHSSRDRGEYHSSSYSSRDKERHRHHPYA